MNIFQILITQPLANGLVLFYKLLGSNMGLAIIGFSLFLRFVLSPLTKGYLESMKKMKDYSPQLEKLKRKYKNDKQKLMQAQADFYRQKGINPGAGCLPYLIQIVVLIALFRVFLIALGGNGDTISKFNSLLYQPLKFSENQIINTKFFYLDITKPDVFQVSFLPFKLPGLVLILAALTQFLSAKATTPYLEKEKKMVKKTADPTDDFQVAMQSSMIYTFPLMTILVGLTLPSGLALYWLVFSLYQLVWQIRASGWGGLTPWLKTVSLLKSGNAREN